MKADTGRVEVESQPGSPIAPGNALGRRHDMLLLVLIVGAAALLRLLFLNKSLWLDEGVAVANAWAAGLPLDNWRDWVRGLWNGEFNMIFYFALLRVWLRVDTSEAFIRTLSVIPAVATVPVVYALGKRLLNPRAGVIAALLLSIHGAHVLYAQEARSYTLVVFLIAFSTWAFVRGIQTHLSRYWLLYSTVAILAIYSHFFAGLVIAAHWVSLAWLPRRSIPWPKFAPATIAILLAAAPAIIFALTNKGQQVDWISRPSLASLANVVSEYAGNPIVLPVYLVLWTVGIRSFASNRPKEETACSRWHGALIVSWLVVPLALTLLVSFKRPMLVPRYLLISVPASVLLASAGALQLSATRRKFALWATVALCLAFIGFRYARPKENWRGASSYVMQHSRDGDAVWVVPWWAEQPFAYYYHFRHTGTNLTEIWTSALPQGLGINGVSQDHGRVWLIVYARPQGLNDPETRKAEEILARGYKLKEIYVFTLVEVRLYERNDAPEPGGSD